MMTEGLVLDFLSLRLEYYLRSLIENKYFNDSTFVEFLKDFT